MEGVAPYSLSAWGMQTVEKLIPESNNGLIKKTVKKLSGVVGSTITFLIGLVESAVTTPFAMIAFLAHMITPNKWTFFHKNPFLRHPASAYTATLKAGANIAIFPFKSHQASEAPKNVEPTETEKEKKTEEETKKEDKPLDEIKNKLDKTTEMLEEMKKKAEDKEKVDFVPPAPKIYGIDRDIVVFGIFAAVFYLGVNYTFGGSASEPTPPPPPPHWVYEYIPSEKTVWNGVKFVTNSATFLSLGYFLSKV